MQARQTSTNLISSVVNAAIDFGTLFAGFQLAVWIRFDTGWFKINPDRGIPPESHLNMLCLIAAAVGVVVFRQLQLYSRPREGRFEDTVPRTLRAIVITLVLYIAVEAATRLDPELSRIALALSLVTVPFCVVLGRYILYRIEWNLARKLPKINRVLIVGTDTVAERLHHAIRKEPFLRATIVGHLTSDSDSAGKMGNAPLLGDWRQCEELCKEHAINQLVIADMNFDRDEMVKLGVFCEQNYIQFQLVPDLFRILTSNVSVKNLAGIPIMGHSQWPLDFAVNRAVKRCFDVAFSVVALLLTSPILLLTALAVKCTSRGPIFYLQERCGENGRIFPIFKFRTMRVDAEANGPGWTTPDDPRRTPIGGFLRKWNIDELPQFANVLLGHMSVVGPRPERPHYVERFKDEIERYMRRHICKPGITGWAQVNGLRGDTSIVERIRYDLFYLENWSVGLDVKTILKTLASRKNAY